MSLCQSIQNPYPRWYYYSQFGMALFDGKITRRGASLKLEQGSHSSAKNLSNCLVGCGDHCTYRVPWLYTSATNSSCTVHQVPWSPCSFSQLIPGTRWKHWQKWKHTRPLIVSTRRTCLNKVHNSRQWLLFLVRRTRPHHQSLGGGAKL